MNKKLLSFGIVSTILILSSGCASNQPQVVEHNTTVKKTVLIPHSENVKKAVVLLISKTKDIEKKIDELKTRIANKDNNNDNTETVQELTRLQKQQIDNIHEIKSLKERIQELQKLQNNIKQCECENKKKETKETSPIVIKNNESKAVDTQYNAIIKDFVGDDLK